MKNKDNEKDFYTLSGQLEKLTSGLIGYYQPKFFSILQNGIKIGYRNLDEDNFSEKNIFSIKQVVVCQAEQQFAFNLETPRRNFVLKAKSDSEKVTWMRAVTKLRKQIIRKKFKNNASDKKEKSKSKVQYSKTKYIQSSTDHTLPNGSLTLLNETQRSMKSTLLQLTDRNIRMSANVEPNPEKDENIKKNFQDLFKNMGQNFVKYNTYVITLKNKVQNLFKNSYNTFTYILFSSKSLYPLQNMCQQNLTNMKLPEWAQINKMYKVINTNQMPKLYMQINKILDIEDNSDQPTSLKVRTDQNVLQFFCQTVEQKNRLKKILQKAIDNYKQVLINGKLSKKNFDRLIWLFNNQHEEFLQKVGQIIAKYIPNNHHYQPQVVIKFIDILIPFIQQFVSIVKNKRQNCNSMILQVLKQIHEEVKVHIKLTWDTSYNNMKGQHILKFLNALSAYHSIIKDFITDIEFMTGMKELSKIYVRQSWKNFQSIILGIVEHEKKNNIFQDEENDFIQTNSITDLFKFIYEVYDLAAPCWNHKLHLHNVQKLMFRAISVFTSELKATVDQSIIANKQIIAIANNYFRFCLTIDEFYNQKFSVLDEKTKQSYDKLKIEFKELSHIILDKLAFDMRSLVRKYFEKASYFKVDVNKINDLLKQSSQNIEVELLHPIFIKRFYQKIFSSIREGILASLQREITSKKKNNVKKIIQQLDSLTFDLIDVANALYKGQSKIQKELNQVNILLSSQNSKQILTLIRASGEDIKKAYMNIINLRQDYYVGGPLYYQINEQTIDRNSLAAVSSSAQLSCKNTLMVPSRLTIISKEQELRGSLSHEYDFDTRSSLQKSQYSYDQPLKLISQGYLMKCKTNKKVWQKEYFRLKNSVLYFYQNQKSQRCQNSIKVQEMTKVFIPSMELPNFSITYETLHREKQIEFKCQDLELRDRWIQSLSLQIRRVRNEDKVKKQKLKLTQKKKNYLIIDYQELMNGKTFFSYSSAP